MNIGFVCPVCRQPLLRDGNSLCCEAKHTFDIARQGYVNLLLKKPDTLYEDKALFAARRAVYEAGFWAPVIEAVRDVLPNGVFLDAGCGEGSLAGRLQSKTRQAIGLDIARPAVQMAAAAYKDADFCVGDLCNIPLADASVDAIVNMLTPANYGEFTRVLKPDGMLIKIVPGENHLVEIREAAGLPPAAHTVAEAAELFGSRFALGGQRHITYQHDCGPELSRKVFMMTPMTEHASAPEKLPERITVDVTMLTGFAR